MHEGFVLRSESNDIRQSGHNPARIRVLETVLGPQLRAGRCNELRVQRNDRRPPVSVNSELLEECDSTIHVSNDDVFQACAKKPCESRDKFGSRLDVIREKTCQTRVFRPEKGLGPRANSVEPCADFLERHVSRLLGGKLALNPLETLLLLPNAVLGDDEVALQARQGVSGRAAFRVKIRGFEVDLANGRLVGNVSGFERLALCVKSLRS
jgi:hypothetical protein